LRHVDTGERLNPQIVPAPVRSPDVEDGGWTDQVCGSHHGLSRNKSLRGIRVASVDPVVERNERRVGRAPAGIPAKDPQFLGNSPVKPAVVLVVITAGNGVLAVVDGVGERLARLIGRREHGEGHDLGRYRIDPVGRDYITWERRALDGSGSARGVVVL